MPVWWARRTAFGHMLPPADYQLRTAISVGAVRMRDWRSFDARVMVSRMAASDLEAAQLRGHRRLNAFDRSSPPVNSIAPSSRPPLPGLRQRRNVESGPAGAGNHQRVNNTADNASGSQLRMVSSAAVTTCQRRRASQPCWFSVHDTLMPSSRIDRGDAPWCLWYERVCLPNK